jgi:hypothetical protein
MSDAGLDRFYREVMGRAALAMDPRPRLKRFAVHDGSRRMLGEKTPRPALDLRLIRRNDREC